MKKWFSYENHISLIISKSTMDSNQTDLILNEINDHAYIQRLYETISSLPVDEDEMMKSFAGDVEMWTLKFTNEDDDSEEIKFYSRKIKTVNTGFYVKKIKAEIDLSTEIKNLITPSFETAIPLIDNYSFAFDEFTVQIKEMEDGPHAPVTAHFVRRPFVIIPDKGDPVDIKIVFGQNPPQPQKFIIGTTEYHLLCYDLKNGDRLYPHYFAITKTDFA